MNKSSKPIALADLFKGHVEICRFDHWIKNVFVVPGIVLALIISPDRDLSKIWLQLVIGMFSIGLIASSNYVINEILDAPYDLMHPKKKFRPVPSGRIVIWVGYVQWILLLLCGLACGRSVSAQFNSVLMSLWFMGCFYNIPPIRSKDLPYLDVLTEAINNPIRMVAGWLMVAPTFAPPVTLLLAYWMVGCYFMAIKRFAEIREIARHVAPGDYRKSFRTYTEQSLLISIMFYAASSMLFLGAFTMRYRIELILAFPLIALVMAVYLNLAFLEDSAAQAPEKLYKDKNLMVAVVLCSLLVTALMMLRIPLLSVVFSPTMPM